ncbi:hypothetical protein, partial [Pseudomonas lactis]|uniref:hypothetical protein n=1 Tax=Pseudomonas lactis TaxID=1615674 RepID=UPI001E539159
QIPVEFRPAWFDGALKIKIKSRSRADQEQDHERLASHRGYGVDRHSLVQISMLIERMPQPVNATKLG